jgi:hypothetical protein
MRFVVKILRSAFCLPGIRKTREDKYGTACWALLLHGQSHFFFEKTREVKSSPHHGVRILLRKTRRIYEKVKQEEQMKN